MGVPAVSTIGVERAWTVKQVAANREVMVCCRETNPVTSIELAGATESDLDRVNRVENEIGVAFSRTNGVAGASRSRNHISNGVVRRG